MSLAFLGKRVSRAAIFLLRRHASVWFSGFKLLLIIWIIINAKIIYEVYLRQSLYVERAADSEMLSFLLSQSFELLLASVIFAVLFPLGLFITFSDRKRILMDFYFSAYLFNVARAIRGGSPLNKAFIVASEGEYGPLKPVLRAFVSKLTLGVPLQNALSTLSKSLKSRISTYSIASIKDLLNLTPEMHVFLDELGTFQSQYVELQKRRESSTRIHVIIIYVAYFTFLLAVGATIKITPFTTGSIPLFSAKSSLSPALFRSISYYVALSESVFLGLLAGEINKGKASSGLLHVAIMTLVLIIFSYLFLF